MILATHQFGEILFGTCLSEIINKASSPSTHPSGGGETKLLLLVFRTDCSAQPFYEITPGKIGNNINAHVFISKVPISCDPKTRSDPNKTP